MQLQSTSQNDPTSDVDIVAAEHFDEAERKSALMVGKKVTDPASAGTALDLRGAGGGGNGSRGPC